MSWDEWEQLKAHAAARGSTRMQLNHASDPVGVGYDRLKSNKNAWAKAGEDLSGLKGAISKALGKLDDGQSGLGGTDGCESAAAQKELLASWKKYVGDVSGRCDELAGLLQRTGLDLAMTDADVKAELDKIHGKYQDTEALGGQTKGK
ncbi:hypothetical protein [Streptomyces sp. NPDC001851]|uniref:hypothetical protein n=1 Tax=Streptomyces sp. NPDC001851 TaxID=3154529 RepID=UPI00333456A7